MVKNIKIWYAIVWSALVFPAVIFAQQGQPDVVTNKLQLAKLRAAVEASPDSLNVHMAYTKAIGTESPELEKQYAAWTTKFPKSAIVPYAIGKAYLDEENPKAKPYLLKAVAINPNFTEAWGGLWQDAERWGDSKISQAYLEKAALSNPSNADYAFYYASSFRGADKVKWVQMSLEVAKHFPNHERGAQALYWLAVRSKEVAEKLKYFELLHRSYAPDKFGWSASGMSAYFNVLLWENAEKALELAQEMAQTEKKEKKQWPKLVSQAQVMIKTRTLLSQRKETEALDELKKIQLSKYSELKTRLELLKAQIYDLAGNTRAAYDSLIVVFAKSPSVQIRTAIAGYGNKLSKDSLQTDADIWASLNAIAQVATPFNGLKRYLTPGTASLSDYKGKVILLTYWFPGCGPCRAEFPHFENVVKKFKGNNLEYLGINILSKQNDYVVPFLKGTGYSFTPLEDVRERVKGNLDNHDLAPMNFLIDKEGRLIFSSFSIDGDNEDDLELMIQMLMDSKNAN
ncbi:redoxin domain-containing protein [Pedobacter montanisoli]|uniref:Redoxin domain-containing protein n=1 Tax=Pedobacter montanisoli TaxID=2923277 RepID=A0ABS9ZSG6_9SPHI|nr:redoxin domain-containing protein [Pedobacter montanisoli]MCJ0741187.1 redoxin domain-containing protein [Pedobacter montanisoli]